MAIEYPDILGDYVEASRRYEADGIQLVAYASPSSIQPGQATDIALWLQNTTNAPMEVAVRVDPPGRAGRLGPPSRLTVIQHQTDLELEPAEVGEMHIPVGSTPKTPASTYEVKVEVRAKTQGPANRVRAQKRSSRLGATVLKHAIGLQLASTVGIGYEAKTTNKLSVKMTVAGAPSPPEKELDLTPSYASMWTMADWELQQRAQVEINNQRIHIIPELPPDAVYLALLEESRIRAQSMGLELYLGEAIFLAKILTYTVQYFLRNEYLQDGLLVPIYQTAIQNEMSLDNPRWLVTRVGYGRILRLAIALSFGLVEDALKRRPWTLEEQVAVADMVVDHAETGQTLPPEFLYIPLVLGGLLVTRDVVMEGEDPQQSLDMIARAKAERSDVFVDEVAEAGELFDSLWQVVARAARPTS